MKPANDIEPWLRAEIYQPESPPSLREGIGGIGEAALDYVCDPRFLVGAMTEAFISVVAAVVWAVL